MDLLNDKRTMGPAAGAPARTPVEYYRHEAVRERLAEYCGGTMTDPESFSAEYLSGVSETLKRDRFSEEYFFSASRSSYFWLLDQGVDLFRAVWDRQATLGILDIEYFNHRYPAEAYFNPQRIFASLEPVCQAILREYRAWGIRPLVIMTGQGYHFSFKVDFSHPAHAALVSLGKLNESVIAKYQMPVGSRSRPVPLDVGRAFDGMGRIQEYFVHLLLKKLYGRYRGMPVVCTDVSVGKAREAIALDLSMYADPLYTRDIRCPFSTYQKHKVLQEKFGYRAAQEVPVFVTLPRVRKKLTSLLKMRESFEKSRNYAAHVSTSIPDASDGLLKLIRSYRASKLFRFHAMFDAARHDSPAQWADTYDRFDLTSVPPCLAHCLVFPNDNLLKPTNIQTLTRVLMKKGWHPKHIAGLMRSKLERDYGWGAQWFRYDASTRADYYVRLFAGLIACGLDTEVDLNCLSHAEKGYCLRPHCGHNLADHRLNRAPNE